MIKMQNLLNVLLVLVIVCGSGVSLTYDYRYMYSTPPYRYDQYTTFSSASGTCPEPDQIHCKTSDRCTRVRYICDGDNDCGDNSDEDSDLCAIWRNSDCERNMAKCTRNGRSDCVTISHYCTVRDPPCTGTVSPRICQMLADEKLQDINSIEVATTVPPEEEEIPTDPVESVHYSEKELSQVFKDKMTNTIEHADCPQLYTKIGNQCISVFFVGNLTWMESKAFCKAIGGDLFVIKEDLSNFLTISQHLSKTSMTNDFWIGGFYLNETTGWKWIDETPMQTGSPIWAVRHSTRCSTRTTESASTNMTFTANDGYCYHYKQAPSDPPRYHCAAFTYRHYYYASDEDCETRKSPLCAIPEDHPQQAL